MFFDPVPAIIASEVGFGEALLPNEDLRTNADPLNGTLRYADRVCQDREGIALIERNIITLVAPRTVMMVALIGVLSGCGGAGVFTDDALVVPNGPSQAPPAAATVAPVQSDGFPNPQYPTTAPLARELTQDERADLKRDLETLRNTQTQSANADRPVDKAAAISQAAAERQRKILKLIEETDRAR